MTFENLLVTQRSHQEQLGVDFYRLACDPRALTEHIQDHLREILVVLGDVQIMLPLPETPEADQRASWETYREAYIVHYVRALYRIAGSLTALGCNDRLLRKLYDQELRGTAPVIAEGEVATATATCVVCARVCDAISCDGDAVALCSATCATAYEGAQVISVAAMTSTEAEEARGASDDVEEHAEEAVVCAEE